MFIPGGIICLLELSYFPELMCLLWDCRTSDELIVFRDILVFVSNVLQGPRFPILVQRLTV